MVVSLHISAAAVIATLNYEQQKTPHSPKLTIFPLNFQLRQPKNLVEKRSLNKLSRKTEQQQQQQKISLFFL